MARKKATEPKRGQGRQKSQEQIERGPEGREGQPLGHFRNGEEGRLRGSSSRKGETKSKSASAGERGETEIEHAPEGGYRFEEGDRFDWGRGAQAEGRRAHGRYDRGDYGEGAHPYDESLYGQMGYSGPFYGSPGFYGGPRYGETGYGFERYPGPPAYYRPGMGRLIHGQAGWGAQGEVQESVRRGGRERGPHWGRGPKGYKRSDERIREDICDRICGEGYVDASDVDVQVRDGEVTLEGYVENRETKRVIEDLSESVMGVEDIHNHLRIRREHAIETSEPQAGEAQTGGYKGRKAR